MPPRLTHSQRRGRARDDRAYDHGRRRSTPQLREAKRFRSSARWRKFRQWFLEEHGLCADPFGHHDQDRRIAVAREVHHIQPLAIRLDLGLDASNCAALCSICHNQVEGKEQAGEPTQQLFWQERGARRG